MTKRFISGEEKLTKPVTFPNNSGILGIYRPDQDCARVLQTRFVHPPVSKEEGQLPIAFGLTVYKGARPLERLLRAVYKPNNAYCIHIEKRTSAVFRKAIRQAIIYAPFQTFLSLETVLTSHGAILM